MFKLVKWLWDPRTQAEKDYEKWNKEFPLQKHVISMEINYGEKNFPRSTKTELVMLDVSLGSATYRHDPDYIFKNWSANVMQEGFMLGEIRISPYIIKSVKLLSITSTPID